MKGEDRADKIAVVVGTVTNDLRIFKIPKLKVSSVQFLVTNIWNFPLKCYVDFSVIAKIKLLSAEVKNSEVILRIVLPVLTKYLQEAKFVEHFCKK